MLAVSMVSLPPSGMAISGVSGEVHYDLFDLQGSGAHAANISPMNEW